MDRGLAALVSGMISGQREMDVITNNLANVNTVGFRRQECVSTDFSVFMQNAQMSLSSSADEALQMANLISNRSQDGVVASATINLENGAHQRTGNSLDLAIEGPGFFTVQTPEGLMYTRNGRFSLNEEGYICTPEGYQLLSDSGPIQYDGTEKDFKPSELKVDKDGNIYDGSQNLGALRIAQVEDSSEIEYAGGSYFVTKDGSELPNVTDGTTIHQGFVELSNVSAINEMARMIEVQRTFETYQKIYQEQEQLQSKLIDQATKA